jgi:hypothetical protein
MSNVCVQLSTEYIWERNKWIPSLNSNRKEWKPMFLPSLTIWLWYVVVAAVSSIGGRWKCDTFHHHLSSRIHTHIFHTHITAILMSLVEKLFTLIILSFHNTQISISSILSVLFYCISSCCVLVTHPYTHRVIRSVLLEIPKILPKWMSKKYSVFPITDSSILVVTWWCLIPTYHSHFDEFSGWKNHQVKINTRFYECECLWLKFYLKVLSSQRGCEMLYI